MRLILLGAPGVGKGTQGDLLAAKFQRPKISTGDILREAVRNKTPMGIQAKACMDQGKLVPDAVVIGIVKDKLGEPVCAKGFLLDGFPRTVPQAEELGKILHAKGLTLDRVVNIAVPREDIVRRLTGRRSCPTCQAVFHVEFSPPKREGICDRCGGELMQRSDDSRETVENRLSVYEKQTAPLIAYYRQRGLLSDVDGAGSVEQVQQRIVELLSAHGSA
jgi:adenylate kinase